jgi:hypothetical protein
MRIERIVGFVCGVALVAVAATLTSPAFAGPIERLFTRDTGYVPACDGDWALGIISWRFAYKEARFWASSDSLTQFGDVREIAYRPWGPQYTPRRYCQAKVRVSDHPRETVVYYSIIEKGGYAGVGWGVEWCVVGWDRNLAYAPNCRAARP